MKKFLKKTKQKIKDTAGLVSDGLGPPSRASTRPASAMSQPAGSLTGGNSSLTPPSSISVPQGVRDTELALNAPVPLKAPELADVPATTPQAQTAIEPLTLIEAQSAIEHLWLVERNGSDLLLPLKAAFIHIIRELVERGWESDEMLVSLRSKLESFATITDEPKAEKLNPPDDIQRHLRAISATVQRLWKAVTTGDRLDQDAGQIRSLLGVLISLIEVFEVGNGVADGNLMVVYQNLPSQPPILVVNNNNSNTTYNFGRDVVNNNWAINYIFPQSTTREDANNQEKVMKKIKAAIGDRFVVEALHDTQPMDAGCMPGTRATVLLKFMAWAKNESLRISWLAGMAGTGKTSIAITLCQMLHDDPGVVLGGTFFCSRSAGSIARTEVRRILVTLAVSLAAKSPEYATALLDELKTNNRIVHQPVGDQIIPLFVKPCARLSSTTRPIVFVIDALDECTDERELAQLLTALANMESDAPVKFILTSRPEMHIRGTPISNPDHSTILQLHTISEEEVMADISHYIAGTLQAAAPDAVWYTNDDVQRLADLSRGLFIFASTALKYILDPENDEDRQERLSKANAVVTRRTAAIATMDKMYELVLTEASREDKVDDDELEKMKRILACILTARAPLSVQALADLMTLRPAPLRGSLRRLHSLVYLPPRDAEPGLRTLHTSFGDYFFHRSASHVRTAASLGHDVLAHGCLYRMSLGDLCFNVSRSRSSYKPNPPDRPLWLALSLVYACIHWAHHIDAATDCSAFESKIGQIFRHKFLFWLEVLSVLHEVGIASGVLRTAQIAVKQDALSQFLRDANSFVASSRSAIEWSAPHIYLSALPFAPKDSLIYKNFATLCTGLVSVETVGIDRHGERLVMTLTGHESAVRSVAYSPDGGLIISGSYGGTVRIWNAFTGEETMPPLGDADSPVLSVDFFPDGTGLVAGTEAGDVCMWRFRVGGPAFQRLSGHLGPVASVKVSPNGSIIASGAHDSTVCFWDISTGQQLAVLDGHSEGVMAVAFSPDSATLASSSLDAGIILWSCKARERIGESLTGHFSPVFGVCFSPDGIKMASSFEDGEIWLWNYHTRSHLTTLRRHSCLIWSVQFSPDGQSLVSVGDDRAVHHWSLTADGSADSSVLFEGHTDSVNSVTFSPSGMSIASASGDRTIRIWDALRSGQSRVQPLPAHDGDIYAVAIASGAEFIASGSQDHTVKVWDIRTGEPILPPLLGHMGDVRSVAISSDGRLIVSGSDDRSIRLWDAKTGEAVGEPLCSHQMGVNAVALSPDGQWLASCSWDETVRIWMIATAQPSEMDPLFCESPAQTVAFSPDAQLLAAGQDDGRIQIWRAATGELVCDSLEADTEPVRSIGFSPDGLRIAHGAQSPKICVWDIATRQPILVLEGHTHWVFSVTYSLDGRFICSGSLDKTVRLWDSATGVPVAKLCGHAGWVHQVAFTSDMQSIISCSSDKTLRVWSIEQACTPLSASSDEMTVALASTKLYDDGWARGRSEELFLWVPADYRAYLCAPPCTLIIGERQIFLTADVSLLHRGQDWTKCWNHLTSV